MLDAIIEIALEVVWLIIKNGLKATWQIIEGFFSRSSRKRKFKPGVENEKVKKNAK